MPSKKPSNDELRRMINAALDAGRVEFAPPPRDAYFLPEFVECFSREILGNEWRNILATEETSVMDFKWWGRHAEAVAEIRRVYGADCADLPDLNLWVVMMRCADERGAERES